MISLAALFVATTMIINEVDLTAEDGLDALFLAGLVEVDGTVHNAVVGETQRRLTKLRGPRGKVFDVTRAIEQRVLGVDVEVDCGGAHRMILCGEAAGGFGGPSPVSRAQENDLGPNLRRYYVKHCAISSKDSRIQSERMLA